MLHEGDPHDDAPQNVPLDVLNRAIEAWEKERQARIALEKLHPSYKDIVANDPQEVTVTRIAKDYGWSATKLNCYLQEHHVQEKKDGVWVLLPEYADKGYTHTAHTKIIPESGEPYERVRPILHHQCHPSSGAARHLSYGFPLADLPAEALRLDTPWTLVYLHAIEGRGDLSKCREREGKR